MEWNNLLNFSRLRTDTKRVSNDARSEPEKDSDRILFSGAFRRLARKTQVHPFAVNDHVHNRLTHSIEVSRVGKSLGKAVHAKIKKDLPKDVTASDIGSILEAACLAHDIGNPPFGHAGEEAMMHWFGMNKDLVRSLSSAHSYDISKFDGNAQGFRILTQTENHLFSGGLRLTYATLATFLKYPNTVAPGINKFSVFLSEKDILDEIASVVGLPSTNNGYLRHPLAYLAEAADDICYCVLDLEDAVELKILEFDEIEEMLLRPFEKKEKERIRSSFASSEMFRINLSRLRGPVFDCLIEAAIEGFMRAYSDIMSDKPAGDLFSCLGKDDPRAKVISEAKCLGKKKIYSVSKKLEVELGSFSTLDTLLTELFRASKANWDHISPNKLELDWKSQLIMSLLGDHKPKPDNPPSPSGWTEYLCYRRAIDFISGMTDNYATYIAKQLRGMGI